MTHESKNNWTKCSGELNTLVRDLSRNRMQRTILRRTCFGLVATALLIGAGFALGTTDESARGPMNCFDVKSRTQEFLTDSMDAEDTRRFELHIGKCESCMTFVERMRSEVASVKRQQSLYWQQLLASTD
jgi:hypothetical protein